MRLVQGMTEAESDMQFERRSNAPATDHAFISFVDRLYLRGFCVLLKSLVLNSAHLNQDYIVLHDGLEDTEKELISSIYPNVVFRRVEKDAYSSIIRGDKENYLYEKAYYSLESFRIGGYQKLIYLDCDMVIVDDISDLFLVTGPLAAVEQFYHNDGGKKLNSGLLVIDQSLCDGRFFAELMEIAHSGQYELDKHDQGLLNARLNGNFERISWRYNAVKRRLASIKAIPAGIKVLHFTGPKKPWSHNPEKRYAVVEQRWHDEDVALEKYWIKALVKYAKGGNIATACRFARFACGAAPVKITDLRQLVDALLRRGQFEEASEFISVAREDGNWKLYFEGRIDAANGRFGRALKKLSDCLERVGGVPKERILEALFDVAWVAGETATARLYHSELERLSPLSGVLEGQTRKLNQDVDISKQQTLSKAPYFGHVAFYVPPGGNAGDLFLPDAVRRSIALEYPDHQFVPIHVHQAFGERQVGIANKGDAVVVGGGGLFLSDTSPNAVSGWQWNISLDRLSEIQRKLVFFAVGYNRFRGQREFSRVFTEHLKRCVDKSAFFGLRNHGSIAAIKSYLPEDLKERVQFQPCPTTISKYLYPEAFETPVERRIVGLNIAFDRSDSRFGDRYGAYVREIAAATRRLRKDYEVIYVAHTVGDERFLFDLARLEGIHLRSARLFEMTLSEIIAFYRTCCLVIGMRGHAGMIPFGCGTPIISLVTHPKLRYFLEDVKLPDWAIDTDENFGEALFEQSITILSDLSASMLKVQNRMDELRDITEANVRTIRSSLTTT